MSQQTEATMVNGVNLDDLMGNIKLIKQTPSLAQFKFRADGEWIDGARNRTKIKGFYGTHQELQHAEEYEHLADEPPILCGSDKSANPAEYLLSALAGCLTTSMVYHAAVRGIRIDELDTQLEGDVDIQGFLGLTDDVPRGLQGITVKIQVKSDASAEQLKQLAEYSVVYHTLKNPLPVSLEVIKDQ